MNNEQDPFLLIIDTSFAQFDPTTNQSAIVWFSDWSDRVSIHGVSERHADVAWCLSL